MITSQSLTYNPTADTPPASPLPNRPGYQTTEFWASTVAPTVFLLLAQFRIGVDTSNPHVEAYVKLGSYIFAALGVSFYAISRGHMKKGAAIALAIKEVFGGANLANFTSALQQAAPKQVTTALEPLVTGIKSVDPEFSESQLEDLTSIVHGMLTHPQTKAQYEAMITNAVNAAVHNVMSNADSPTPLLQTAQTVKAVEDTVEAATATDTPPVDATGPDGAEFVAPQFS